MNGITKDLTMDEKSKYMLVDHVSQVLDRSSTNIYPIYGSTKNGHCEGAKHF